MKRKPTAQRERPQQHFSPVPLYRNHLDDMFQLAQARGLEAKISDKEYEYESLDDLRQSRGDRITEIRIDFGPPAKSEPSVNMTFGETLWDPPAPEPIGPVFT